MKVKVELQAYLEQYSPNGNDLFDYEVPDGSRVTDLVAKLGIPTDLASMIIVGDHNADPSYALKDGDRVTLVPPIAGGAGPARPIPVREQ
jgi:molybdopterin converting factor small subunit